MACGARAPELTAVRRRPGSARGGQAPRVTDATSVIRVASTASRHSDGWCGWAGGWPGQLRSPTAAPRRQQPGSEAARGRDGGRGGGGRDRRGCRDHPRPLVSAGAVGGVCRARAVAATQSRASFRPLEVGQIGKGSRSTWWPLCALPLLSHPAAMALTPARSRGWPLTGDGGCGERRQQSRVPRVCMSPRPRQW